MLWRIITTCLLNGFIAVQLMGQQPFLFKINPGALYYNGLQLGFETKHAGQSALECQFTWEAHPQDRNLGLFDGKRIRKYSEEKLDTFVHLTSRLTGTSGWQYINGSAPMGEAPAYVPHSSMHTAALFRVNFIKPCIRWSFFMQTGLQLMLHRYFAIRDTRVVTNRVEFESYISPEPFARDIKYSLISYDQIRAMELKNSWRVGLAYQMGASYRLNRHIRLEARLDTGVHIGPPPYEDPAPPASVGRVWVKPGLILALAL